ncbi:uncharacterized protein G2W53_022603 [Senna tora]|uniref:SWIM-type domain-containing protein n=1 Tax=Senna tora TaxID=362788 RepID=A0A834TUN9_9FABA|nr:uncharacterized protein G2W53_022603 [Senna tora]
MRYSHMTINLAESMNAVFKGVRALPITRLVKATYYRLNAYFTEHSRKYAAQLQAGRLYSETVHDRLNKAADAASGCRVITFDRVETLFEVMERRDASIDQMGRTCRVNLAQEYCDCGKFQALHYPCQHVIAACAYIGISYEPYVNRVYKLDTMLMAYAKEFQPLGLEEYWPVPEDPRKLVPGEGNIRKKGRPRATRFRNEMDFRDLTMLKCSLFPQSFGLILLRARGCTSGVTSSSCGCGGTSSTCPSLLSSCGVGGFSFRSTDFENGRPFLSPITSATISVVSSLPSKHSLELGHHQTFLVNAQDFSSVATRKTPAKSSPVTPLLASLLSSSCVTTSCTTIVGVVTATTTTFGSSHNCSCNFVIASNPSVIDYASALDPLSSSPPSHQVSWP